MVRARLQSHGRQPRGGAHPCLEHVWSQPLLHAATASRAYGYRRAPTASSSSSRTPAARWRWCAREGTMGPTWTYPSRCEMRTASSCRSLRRGASPSSRSRSASRRGAAARSQTPSLAAAHTATHRSRFPPSSSWLPSGSERRAQAAWAPKRGLRWRSDAGPKSLISAADLTACDVQVLRRRS